MDVIVAVARHASAPAELTAGGGDGPAASAAPATMTGGRTGTAAAAAADGLRLYVTTTSTHARTDAYIGGRRRHAFNCYARTKRTQTRTHTATTTTKRNITKQTHETYISYYTIHIY